MIREKTKMGDHCSVGTLSDIQGHATFGDYCRLHSNAHVCQGTKIGNFVYIYPYVVFTNDPTPPSNVYKGVTVGDYSIISTGSIIMPGIKIGENCLVGAGCVVTKMLRILNSYWAFQGERFAMFAISNHAKVRGRSTIHG